MQQFSLLTLSLLGLLAFETKAPDITLCPAPTSIPAKFFKMIENPSTKVEDVLAFLNKTPVAIDVLNARCETPLYTAVRANNLPMLQALFKFYKSPDVNEFSEKNLYLSPKTNLKPQTLYSWAVLVGNVETIEWLKSWGGVWDYTKNYEATALTSYCAHGTNMEKLKYLLNETNADVNHAGIGGHTPLIMALSNSAPREFLEALLNAGAKVNVKTDKGATPLMIATLNSDADFVKVLIGLDADVNAETADGVTALMCAAEAGTPEMLRHLINAGAFVNQSDKKGRSAIYFASTGSTSGDVIRLLVREGALVNFRIEGATLLHRAALSNPAAAVTLALIQAGIDVNITRDTLTTDGQPATGLTPLMDAATHNPSPEVVRTLLREGANKKLTDNFGRSAFDLAQLSAEQGVRKKALPADLLKQLAP